MKARAIMVLGTGSHVGKSVITAALCRILAQEGVRVAPFKSQNMSLNSAATADGLEIGRAQALQAEAAGIAPTVHMNPILLKPAGDMSSQAVVRGRIWKRLTAWNYHQHRVIELMPVVQESYEILAAEYDVIVLEGAGSPAEINLKQNDIVNMRMAEMADAACVLVGDIDRGGVFASILGTIALLDKDEQDRIHGFIINKFRGDIALLKPGIQMMEERIGKPCLGVIPYVEHLGIDEEDSLGITDIELGWGSAMHSNFGHHRPLRIAVVALPSFSNFTDFDALRAEPSITLCFTRESATIRQADVVIIPGSKQTVEDLLWLRAEALDTVMLEYAKHGLVVGLCGGMQMLGRNIRDPHGVERAGTTNGLNLLPISTTMQSEKVTAQAVGQVSAAVLFGQPCDSIPLKGYEIHVGETRYLEGSECFAKLTRGATPGFPIFADGCIANGGRVFGTYLHGLFDQDELRHAFLSAARAFHQLAPAEKLENWKTKREESLNRIADVVRDSVDIARIFDWVGLSYRAESSASRSER
jgi:adenosylcobyric acid synthase